LRECSCQGGTWLRVRLLADESVGLMDRIRTRGRDRTDGCGVAKLARVAGSRASALQLNGRAITVGVCRSPDSVRNPGVDWGSG
jgi:hypothetical protein